MRETIGEELSSMEVPYGAVLDASITKPKAEEERVHITVCVPDLSSKLEKVWIYMPGTSGCR